MSENRKNRSKIKAETAGPGHTGLDCFAIEFDVSILKATAFYNDNFLLAPVAPLLILKTLRYSK